MESSRRFNLEKRVFFGADNATSVLGNCTAVDPAGNLYIAGTGTGAIQFGTAASDIYTSSPGYSVFIVKYDSSGRFVWIRGAGSGSGSDDARGNFIAVDKYGNAYVTSTTRRGSDNYYSSYGYKWNAAGVLVWTTQIGGNTPSPFRVTIATDATENIFATGTFYGSADFDPGPDILSLTSAGGGDVFLLKMNQPSGAPLPLALLQFSVSQSGLSNQLYWQTAQEQNTASFVVERSADNSRFSPIGSVGAAGNSSFPREYSFTDPQPFAGTSFYRLKTLDRNGAFAYSKIVAAKRTASLVKALEIFPVPATDVLHVQITGTGAAILQIINAAGRMIKQQKAALHGTTSFSLDIQSLPTGKYYLLLQCRNERIVQEFTRQ